MDKYSDSKYFDFTIVCSDGILYFSKYLLAQNRVFKTALDFINGESKENMERKIKSEFNTQTMSFILNSLDPFGISMKYTNISDIYRAADYYEVNSLKLLCQNIMISDPKEEYINIDKLYNIGIKTDILNSLLKNHKVKKGSKYLTEKGIIKLFKYCDKTLVVKTLQSENITITQTILDGLSFTHPIEMVDLYSIIYGDEHPVVEVLFNLLNICNEMMSSGISHIAYCNMLKKLNESAKIYEKHKKQRAKNEKV